MDGGSRHEADRAARLWAYLYVAFVSKRDQDRPAGDRPASRQTRVGDLEKSEEVDPLEGLADAGEAPTRRRRLRTGADDPSAPGSPL